MRGVSAGRVVWIGGMCEERSDEMKGFYRHYAGAKRKLELTDLSSF